MRKTKKIATYVILFAVIAVCMFQIPVYAPGGNLVTEAVACSAVECCEEPASAVPISFHKNNESEQSIVFETLAGLCSLEFFLNAMMSLSMMRVASRNEKAKKRCIIQAAAYGTGTIFGIAWFVSLQICGPTWGGVALGSISVLSAVVGTIILVRGFIAKKKAF